MNQNQYEKKNVSGDRFIRYVLLTNGLSTGILGIIIILFPHFVASLTGLDRSSYLVGTGIFLLIFIAFVFGTVKMKFIRPLYVLIFSVVDFLWVIGSIFLIAENGTWFTMTFLGIWIVVLVALVVGAFAICEFYYWWVNRSLKKG
ncbi:hypothetical protein MUG84_07525 [Paenibacillus sp. KQZ6P-2]|uniref:Uncharacterized protein n=1 Tax=Paenibacillus mangrovi TaxID=2931978 RepID=A0A9X1WTN2_9BACL|nr:hypothetical protein [Paenibacillus mangrovi]MCJ8011599.1 hypothetical protein [Paenibacillus mangrovi]